MLTDPFASYREGQLTWENAASRMLKATVHCPQESSYLGKVHELQAVFRTVRPAHVRVLAYHSDPLPFVAAASLLESVTQVFFHHGDHQPSLGCTLEGYVHVDFSEYLQKICQHNLARPAIHLPVCVPDQGIKRFSKPTVETLSVVSSGGALRYRKDGHLAYPTVIAEILRAFGGRYWHIGTLEPSWRNAIAIANRGCGMPEARFKYVANVSSLWQTLHEIDAHVYLGSFPVYGARESVEAQGCGYPLVDYSSPDRLPLLMASRIFLER